MNPTNQPVSFYGDNSKNTDASLLAAMATKDYYNPVDAVAASSVFDLRHEVGETRSFIKDSESHIRREIAKSESDIRRDILVEGQDNMAAVKDAECSLSKEVLDTKLTATREIMETKHSLAKDILRSEYENKLAIQVALKEIKENAQYNSDRTQDKIAHGFEKTSCAIVALDNKIDKGFCHAREEALEEKVFKLSQDLQTSQISRLIQCGCDSAVLSDTARK